MFNLAPHISVSYLDCYSSNVISGGSGNGGTVDAGAETADGKSQTSKPGADTSETAATNMLEGPNMLHNIRNLNNQFNLAANVSRSY